MGHKNFDSLNICLNGFRSFPSLSTPLMKILDSKMSRAGISNLQYAQVACSELASVQKRSNRAKLGLKRSAQILLEIIKVAQVGWWSLSSVFQCVDDNPLSIELEIL